MSSGLQRPFVAEQVEFGDGIGLEWLQDRPDPVIVVADPVGDAPLPADHVMGASGASRTLLTLTPRTCVRTSLDLGSGCGVGSVALAEHSEFVVASDISERALSATRASCRASAVRRDQVACVRGSFTEAFAAESFDLITANPPFVIGPRRRHAYRDSPAPGDSVTAELLADVRRVLRPGGWAVIVTSWLHPDAGRWEDRVSTWLPADCLAWVAQRDVLGPADYVDFWLRDSRESGSAQLRGEWLSYLETLSAAAVGFGWIVLHRPITGSNVGSNAVSSDVPVHWVEDVSTAQRLPFGAEVVAECARRMHAPSAVDLLDGDVVLADAVKIVDFNGSDLGSWSGSAAAVVLVSESGWRAPEPLDPCLSWLLLADRGVALQHRLADCADGLAMSVEDVLLSWLPGVRGLMERGFVTLDLG